MAGDKALDEVYVLLPDEHEGSGMLVLSWALSHFSKEETAIVIVWIDSMTRGFKGYILNNNAQQASYEEWVDSFLNKYLSECAARKFRARKLVCDVVFDFSGEIRRIIDQYDIKNLVMRATPNSDMTGLESQTANKLIKRANSSCKLWFVHDGKLIFTREPYSNKLTAAPSEDRFMLPELLEELLCAAESSISAISDEGDVGSSVDLCDMLQEALVESEYLNEILNEESIKYKDVQKVMFGAYQKVTLLMTQLAKEFQLKEEQRRKHNKELLKELQEIEKLKRDKCIIDQENEDLKIENQMLKNQRDENLYQLQDANEQKLVLQKRISDSELALKDVKAMLAATKDRINSLEMDYNLLRQERDKVVKEIEELRHQRERESMLSRSRPMVELNSEFSLQELKQATQNFDNTLKLGEGGFGCVYKGSLRKTTVAIKKLHPQSLQGQSEFKREIAILTRVRHPNLVTLIGACSEAFALVYEFLPNGSLEDRIVRANNSPPLTWQVRTRIIGEICLALIFLHSQKPKIVVHGDLKPDNILLDANLVSKLSDFGISRLLNQPNTNTTAFYQTSHPIGTFAYIDPEFLLTGKLTPQSDVYSFGIIILRLITGKPPLNIARIVEDAMRNKNFQSLIDESAGRWPFQEAKKLADIGLRCADMYRSRRPNLVNEVWTVVEPLMKAASSSVDESHVPSQFICPIFQDIMKDPHIAADGFTYEAEAIKCWLNSGHYTSPMTNLPLSHRDLIPNFVLRSAIQEWVEQHPQTDLS